MIATKLPTDFRTAYTTLGWASGTFTGRSVSLPYSPNAGHVRGVAGERSFAGSVLAENG